MCFIFGIDDETVCFIDHLLFTHRTQWRFRCVTLSQCGVLHRGQGVCGVDQRHRPAIPGQPANLTGEPVVRMHHVVVPRFVVGFGPQHARSERAELGRQVVLVETFERARDHVAHQHAGGDRNHGRVGRGRRSGEDLDFHTPSGHMQRGLQNVDVHAPGVSGARLGQWRGVHRDHRHPARQHAAGRIGQIPGLAHLSIFTPLSETTPAPPGHDHYGQFL